MPSLSPPWAVFCALNLILIPGLSLDCSGKCFKHVANYYICNGKCISTDAPCNNRCLDPNYFSFNGTCRNKAEHSIWNCNGEYQGLNEPCDGTCRGFDIIRSLHTRRFGSDSDYTIDTYWKCPNESKCVSSYHLCNNQNQESGSSRDCFKNSHKSREFCDNPDKYGFNLNCSSLNLLQCPGNKTQQCIRTEHLCDGVFHCTDRCADLFQRG